MSKYLRDLISKDLQNRLDGVEETVRFVFSDGLRQAAPGLEVVSATPVTAGCRGVKDEHELELMKLACAVTLRAYEATWRPEYLSCMRQFADILYQAREEYGFTRYDDVYMNEGKVRYYQLTW